FTPNKFHTICDGKPNTVTFIKVKGTEEILGGYNPLKWETTGKWGETKDSFIFSFKGGNIKDAIISNVKNANYALDYSSSCGPTFGYDLTIYSSGEFTDYNEILCNQKFYEKKIRNTKDNFLI